MLFEVARHSEKGFCLLSVLALNMSINRCRLELLYFALVSRICKISHVVSIQAFGSAINIAPKRFWQ